MKEYSLVVAVTNEWGIGNNGTLPWHPKRLHLDMNFLKFVTTHTFELKKNNDGFTSVIFKDLPSGCRNIVIMGRKTWDSLPPKFRPLEGRINCVITSDPSSFMKQNEGVNVYAFPSLEDALGNSSELGLTTNIFILGGARLYGEALQDPACKIAFVTRLEEHHEMPCDTYFPGEVLNRTYGLASNITGQCLDLLRKNFPTSAQVTWNEASNSTTENDIKYSIQLFTRR